MNYRRIHAWYAFFVNGTISAMLLYYSCSHPAVAAGTPAPRRRQVNTNAKM